MSARVDFESKDKCFDFEGMRSWMYWCRAPRAKASTSEMGVIQSLSKVARMVPEIQPGASMGLIMGVYAECALLLMLGLWVWLGPWVSNLMEALFPWPVKYLSIKADSGEEKFQEPLKDSEKAVVLDV